MKLSASVGLTGVETKQCADKLLKTTTKATDTPVTGILKFERGRLLVGKDGIQDSVPEHHIHPDSVVVGSMSLRVLLLDF